jgi:hypothetical protein
MYWGESPAVTDLEGARIKPIVYDEGKIRWEVEFRKLLDQAMWGNAVIGLAEVIKDCSKMT